jgi:hypothetical protein
VGQVIYLDIDDEITTAVARIRDTDAGPVILVVPWGSRLASSRINFRLLAREAVTPARDLVIVAPEPAARSLAASAGLPTFATVMEFEAATAPVTSAVPGTGVAPGASAAETAGGSRNGRPSPVVGDLSVVTGLPSPLPAADGVARSAGAGSGLTAQPTRGRPEPPSLPTVGRARPRGPSRARIGIVLAVIGALVLGGAVSAAVFLPSAEITIEPATATVGPLALVVTADPAVQTPDPARLVVPAINLEVPVSVKGEFPATGKELIEAKASGVVTFQNCDTGRVHTFPAGSTVKTAAGVAFVTAGAVRLDRAKIKPAFACTAESIGVTAAKAGPEGNVVAGAIDQLPSGFDPLVLSVVNRAATTGGTRQEIVRVVQADLDAALATLRTQLGDAFAAKLTEPGLPPPGTALVSQTQRLGDALPNPDPGALVGHEQASFQLALAASGTVTAVDSGLVTTVAETRIQSAVAAGYRLVPASARATVDPPAISAGTVTFAVRVRAEQVREIDAAALLERIRGRSIGAARTILEPYGAVRISVWPDWVTAIPSLEGRVSLVVAPAPGPSGSPGPASSPAATPIETPRLTLVPSPAPSSRTSTPSGTRRP